MFGDIIIDVIRNNKLAQPSEENDCLFHILKTTLFIYTGGHFNIFTGKKDLRVSRSSMCTFPFKNDMKHYLTHILRSENSSGDMNEKVDHWLDSVEKFHKKYIIMPSISLNSSFLEESLFISVR